MNEGAGPSLSIWVPGHNDGVHLSLIYATNILSACCAPRVLLGTWKMMMVENQVLSVRGTELACM